MQGEEDRQRPIAEGSQATAEKNPMGIRHCGIVDACDPDSGIPSHEVTLLDEYRENVILYGEHLIS
jgi:hypothetical protein